ncbi:MAG TPA: TonB-dependent receptor [Hyphomicrobiales bacterium]|nr:TonB-dependent receptor [Hyphomicrobiales bacterium]
MPQAFGLMCRKPLALCVAMAALNSAHAQTGPIEEVEIYGSRASLTSALERQRNADKVVGVIDSDAIGNFADINVSESLRRISGIMVENDQGEGRYVSVRGMNTDLNAMTINGVSTASPEDRRGVMLDGVPTDMLDSMTVYKTLTPNLDADTIGGAIDLETISAFKFDAPFVRLKAETSYNELTKDGSNPSLSATMARRFQLAGGELGAALILSDQSRHIVAHNNETGGWSDVAPNSDIEWRFYDLTRDRRGIVFNLDHRLPNGNLLYLHTFHNEYADDEYRGKWETRSGLEDNDPVISGSSFTYANTRMDTEARVREEVREISSVQLGGEFKLRDGLELKVQLFGSRAEQDDTDQVNVVYRSALIDQPVTWDNSNPKKPALDLANGYYDPATFKLNAFEAEYALATDRDVGLRFDLMQALGNGTELQYGAKLRRRSKENDFDYCGYEPLFDMTLAQGSVREISPYFSTPHGPSPSAAGAQALRSRLGGAPLVLADGTRCPGAGNDFEFSGDEEAESIPADWYTDEDVNAAYVMATTTAAGATWVYGLRYEDTRASYRGKRFVDEVYEGIATFNNDYSFLAPSVNVKFDLSDTQVLRLGVFRSLVRPGFNESRAGSVVDVEDNRISSGNPALDPTKAWNFDVSYEWYLSEASFFSAGLFHKRIDGAIVEVDAQDIDVQGKVWQRAETYLNTEASSITGAELAYQTAFDNGLLFQLNWTYADGDSKLPADAVSGQRTVPYLKQAKNTANAAVGYNKFGWDVRLAANYRDSYLDALGGNALGDRYTSDYLQVDLTVKYQVNEQLLLNAFALNLNDRPEFYYFGNRSRLSQYDEFGTTYGLGARFQF